MKNFVRLLIVGLLLIGLSGVVSAEKFSFYIPIFASFQIPEGYQVRVVDDKDAIDPTNYLFRDYAIDSASFEINFSVRPSYMGDNFYDIHGAYAYDDLGAEQIKERTYDSSMWHSKYITLKNGHRAHLQIYYDEKSPSKKEIYAMRIQVIHSGYEMKLWITHRDNKTFEWKPMTYEDKKLAYEILMSLDF